MVHEVTMDTVRIITSSVSGMTSVSWPAGLAHGPMAQVCAVRGCEGENSPGPGFCTVASPSPTTWEDGRPQSFQLPELIFQDSLPWCDLITFTRAVPGTR